MAKSPWSFKQVLDAVENTRTGSNVRKLPLDALANQARNATPRVVDAQCELDRLEQLYKDKMEEAEVYLATMKSEFEKRIDEARCTLQKAEQERKRAQYAFTREAIESGVYEGIKDLNELARAKELETE